MRTRWTEQELVDAVKGNISMAGTLRQLQLVPKGGNYRTAKAMIARLGLDTAHWLGKAHLRGQRRLMASLPLEAVLKENSEYSRGTLKKRLLDEGLIKKECGICHRPPEWEGKPLVLVLDHVNGINNDCRRENLRLVCPNCNSQLPTFCGRQNKGKGKGEKAVFCSDCGRKVGRSAKRCEECAHKAQRRVERPTREQLIADVGNMTMVSIGQKYGVSDNAVKKWMRAMGLL